MFSNNQDIFLQALRQKDIQFKTLNYFKSSANITWLEFVSYFKIVIT